MPDLIAVYSGAGEGLAVASVSESSEIQLQRSGVFLRQFGVCKAHHVDARVVHRLALPIHIIRVDGVNTAVFYRRKIRVLRVLHDLPAHIF